MITVNKRFGNGNRAELELYGISTDEKPVDKIKDIAIFNGSVFYEMDTGKLFIFDEENRKWWEV